MVTCEVLQLHWSPKASLRGHVSLDLLDKEESVMGRSGGQSILGRMNSKCKGPVVGSKVAHTGIRRKIRLVGGQGGHRECEQAGARPHRTLLCAVRPRACPPWALLSPSLIKEVQLHCLSGLYFDTEEFCDL